jgi:uncharacterized protein
MQTPTHAINWFEIPVNDFERARLFYETIFGYTISERQVGTSRMGFLQFDFQNEGRGGAIVYDPEFYTPSANGTLIYLNCEPDLQTVLDKIEPAGGKILRGKIAVSAENDMGYWALMLDTEGNRVALHSLS